MPQSRPNVRQHVVPQVYLKQFGDASGTLQVQEIDSGKIFPSRPSSLCVEKDVYTLIDERKRDDSFDHINNVVEELIGQFYNEVHLGKNFSDQEQFTKHVPTLAVFTANLIARSRVLRDHFVDSINAANRLITQHPEFLANFPEEEYQKYLASPELVKGESKTAQSLRKYAKVLKVCNTQPCNLKTDSTTTKAALDQLAKIHYPVLLKPRTVSLTDVMINAGVKANLLVSESGNFISADDPVVFIENGKIQSKVNAADITIWSDSNRSLYLPLRSDLALLWSVDGSFSCRIVNSQELIRLNRLVAENAIRHGFARNARDFNRKSN